MKNEVNDVEKKRPNILLLGTITALAMTLLAFEWPTITKTVEFYSAIPEDDNFELDEIKVVKIKDKEVVKKPVKKPKPMTVQPKVVEKIELVDNTKDNKDLELDLFKDEIIDDFSDGGGNNEDSTFRIVEVMPHFASCENVLDEGAQKMCTDERIMKHIGRNIKYPKRAKRLGQGGTVHVTYVVDKKGNVRDAHVERPLFPDLDEEALRVVNSLPKMKPGMQRGRPVNVMFTIPITYTLR